MVATLFLSPDIIGILMTGITLIGDSMLTRTTQDGAVALIPRLESRGVHPTVMAVSGASSRAALHAIQAHGFIETSLVLVSIGMNDAAPWKQVPLPEFVKNYRAIIEKIGHKNIVIIAPNPVDIKKQTSPGRDNTIVRQYGETAIALAKEYSIRSIDMFEAVTQYEGISDLYVADGVHLSTAGYDLLFAQLEPILSEQK